MLDRRQVLTSVAATLDEVGFSAGDRQRLNVEIRRTIRDRDYSKRGRIFRPGGKTTDPQSIVKNLIMERDLFVVIGASRAGKSTLLTYLMGSVARGTDFLGLPVKKRGGVLIVATELRGRTQARLNVLDPANELPVRLVHVPPFGTDEGWNNMVRLVMIAIADMVLNHDDAPVLIIVETLRTSGLIKKDEVSNTDMSNALQRLSVLRNITHTGVAVTHHTQKADRLKFSGADAVLTNADGMMTVYKEDEDDDNSLRLVRVDKVAEGEPPTLMGFYIKPHETGRIDDEGTAGNRGCHRTRQCTPEPAEVS